MPYIGPVLQNRRKKHNQCTLSKALSTKGTKQLLVDRGTLVPHTHKNSWNLFPVLEGSCNCMATIWMTRCRGLPSCPPPCAWQHRAGCKAREMTPAPRQGQACTWHHLPLKKMAFPILRKGISSPKAPPGLSVWPPLSVRRPLTTSSPTQPGPQPRSLKLLHSGGRNRHVPKTGRPLWRNTTIHGASRTANWARSCLSRQSYSISWAGWRFSHCNTIFLF